MAVNVDHTKCTGCKSCEEVCPTGAITIINEVVEVSANDCIDCNACIDACPEQAIEE